MTRIWWILTQALKSLKICTFIGSYCAKYLMFDLKKYKGVIFHDTEEWCKIWRKTDLWFGKWHEVYGKFSPEHLEVSNIFPLMGSFCAKCILLELKKVQRSYLSWHWRVMQNLKRNWLVFSKLTRGIWLILMWAVESLKICTWWVPFVESIYNFRWKSAEELSFMTLKCDTKFGEESNCHFKIDKRNLKNFDLSTWKSQKFSL